MAIISVPPFWIGNASTTGDGHDMIVADYGKTTNYKAYFSVYFDISRATETTKKVKVKLQKIKCLPTGSDMTKDLTIHIQFTCGSGGTSFWLKETGKLWNKGVVATSTSEPVADFEVPNEGETLNCKFKITIENKVRGYKTDSYSKDFTFSVDNNRLPYFKKVPTDISGTLIINSPSDGAYLVPESTFTLTWSGAKAGDYNPISAYGVHKDNSFWSVVTDKSPVTDEVITSYSGCIAPSSGGSSTWYVHATDTVGQSELTSDPITVNAYSGSKPKLTLTATSTTYGTSGATLSIKASYEGGTNFGNAIIDLPPGVTHEGSDSITINAGIHFYDIDIEKNKESFSLYMYADHADAGDNWRAYSDDLNFTLVKVAPNISSISVTPSYTNRYSAELYDSKKLGRIFNTNATIYGEGTTPLACNTKWYIAHSTNKTTVTNATYDNSSVSGILTSTLSNSNINVNNVVKEGEYFKFILKAENDGQIKTKESEIFYFPYAPLVPSNFKCTNIKGENATVNNSTTLTITTEANFTWTLNNRSNTGDNRRLSYKNLRLESSNKSDAGGVYSNWTPYGDCSTTTTSVERNTDNLIKGRFYGFRIVVEDLEGITSTSNYISTFRSLGPYVTNLDVNLQSTYNDFTAYKPLSRTDNNYYNVSISNNTGNLENDGLTYKVYGRYGTEDTLLFTYTCAVSTTDDKGFVLSGDENITFGGSNSTVIANLPGQVVKNYINSRTITDKNTRYTNFSFYITIEDGYGETVFFNKPFNVDYREAPTWPIGVNFPIGINYNINNSIAYEKMLTTTSPSNDRMINFKEKIRFKFPVMEDLNRTGSEPIDNDVNKYRISVARLNVKPSEDPNLNESTKYSQYTFSSLRDVNKTNLTNKETINGKEYYIYDFEFPQYTVNYFLVFKLEGIDTKDQVSTSIYSNTYLIGCRVQPPILNLTSLEADTKVQNGKTYFNKLTLSCNIVDNGGSKFNNSSYSFLDYNNLERTIKGNDDYKIKMTLQLSTDPNFSEFKTKEFYLTSYAGTYRPYNLLNLNTIEINASDLLIERVDQMKLYARAILDYPIGYSDVSNGVLYNISSEAALTNVSQTLTYFTEAPTIAYRKNRIGINTNTFEENDLVTIVESTGKNIIRIVGSNSAGTEKFTMTLNLKTREIDGIVIDGGSW